MFHGIPQVGFPSALLETSQAQARKADKTSSYGTQRMQPLDRKNKAFRPQVLSVQGQWLYTLEECHRKSEEDLRAHC